MADARGGAHYPPAKVGIMIIRPPMAAVLYIAVNYGLLVYQ